MITETSFTKEKENIRRQVDAAEFDRISMEIAKTIQKAICRIIVDYFDQTKKTGRLLL